MFSTVFDMIFRRLCSPIICFASPIFSQILLASDIPKMNVFWNGCNLNMHLQEQPLLPDSLQTHVATDILFSMFYGMIQHDRFVVVCDAR